MFSNLKNWILLGITTVITVLVIVFSIPGPLSGAAAGFARPFLQFSEHLHRRFTAMLHRSDDNPEARVQQLERQVRELQLELLEAQEARAENRQLRDMLGIAPPPQWTKMVAPVLARDPMNWNRSFRVGRGGTSGVPLGAVVLVGTSVIGRVTDVSGQSAVVTTIADPGCRISARVRGTAGVGTLAGRHEVRWYDEPVCLLDYLPRDEDYREGQVVETSGMGGDIPGGLTIGRVEKWDSRQTVNVEQTSYAQLSVVPTAPFTDFRFVTVVWRKSHGFNADDAADADQ